jgi:hypothetical protein
LDWQDTQNQAGYLIGRTDISIVAPEYVSVEMETSYGDIGAKKHFSSSSAKTQSGKISLGSVGELNAYSDTGNITLDMYYIIWKNNQKVHTKHGNIALSYHIAGPDTYLGTSKLTITMSGGTGDADLYLRKGSKLTEAQYSCRPYKNGNNETCTANNPGADTWHVGVFGYSAYSGVSLKSAVQ